MGNDLASALAAAMATLKPDLAPMTDAGLSIPAAMFLRAIGATPDTIDESSVARLREHSVRPAVVTEVEAFVEARRAGR